MSTMRAIISEGPGKLRLANDVPTPVIDPASGKVLVKIQAVALNHSDWKMADFSPSAGAVSCYDMCGTIEAVGNGVTSKVSIGDTVLGVTSIKGGAAAEYAVCDGDLLIQVPGNFDVVEASTFGVALTTAGLALFSPEFLGIPMLQDLAVQNDIPDKSKRAPVGPRGWGAEIGGSDSEDDDHDAEEAKTPVLVYGASSATGTVVIQLLRLSGYAPIAVCSPKNFGLVKSRGAVQCFDYHSSGCATQIKQYAHNRLGYVLDCITTASSMKICYDAMGTAGGKYVSLDPFSARIEKSRKDVKAGFCYALTIFGLPVELAGSFAREAKPEDYRLALTWMKIAADLLAKGKLVAHPTLVKPGGLEAIIEGIDMLRKGKISGQKLVYRV